MKKILFCLFWAIIAGNVWVSGHEGWVIGFIVFGLCVISERQIGENY